MKIRDLFGRGEAVVSFEFFPPKSDEGMASLFRTIDELKPLKPSFVSVTYGAGGSTRDRTLELVGRIKNELGIETMAHLTCVGSTVEEIESVLARLGERGIENVLALRGDPPQGQTTFVKPEGGFGYASELARFVRSRSTFCVGGACYPEGHVECPDKELDLRHLKQKVDAGVDFLVSQLFFDNLDYFDFVARARAIGITLPIVPGIMPITNVAQVKRFTQMCGARIPKSLAKRLEGVAHDPEAVVRVGVEHATAQCKGLLEGGAPGVHFYTLNKSPATREVFLNLKRMRLL
ncbi:MAG: methylenetetrahydrofolate reductase [NAD(P)H] [Planctomycetes bacterium]|nr:methylenetetrahydrofolate reductase [NAD(P)H] [Planctomycetota bacterium]